MTATTASVRRDGSGATASTPLFDRPSTTTWIDVAVIVGLSLLAVVGFEPAFGHYAFAAAAVGGIVVGGGVALLGRLLRLSVPLTAIIALAAYFLLGTPLALPGLALYGVLPSLDSLSGLVLGAVFGWSDAVTLQAPLEAPPYVAVVPYVGGWLVSFVSLTLAVRWLPRIRKPAVGRAAVLLIGPVLLFVAAILLGTRDPFFAGVRGVAFAGVALVWLAWRRRRFARDHFGMDAAVRRSRLLGGAAVVVGAVVVGALAGTLLAPPAASRFVVRDEVTPPFDPLDYPSPLAGFRKYTKDLQKTKLFTVRGLTEGQVVRLATMDSYDGVVWSVAEPGSDTDASGAFELLGSTIPEPPLFEPGATSTATIDILDYSDVWLPALGYLDRLGFDAYTGTDPAGTVRVNTATGTTAVTSGVKEGLRYTMQATAQKVPNDRQLQKVPPARLTLPSVTNVPDVVSAKAEEYAGSATTAIQKLRNIERSLKNLGFLSHGRASDPVPSRAGQGADRMTDLLTKSPMVGDQEQYASAFALMARRLGYPTRVVMGFAPKVTGDTTTVTGNDVTAWDEVAFDGVGWVPFFPTPTKTDAPKNQTTKPKLEPQPQVRQPPPADPRAEDLLTPVKTKENEKKEQKHAFQLPAWVWVVGGIVAVPLVLALVPLLVITLLKRRRRRKRRSTGPPDRRAAGAWDELTDRYAELGLTLPERATRLQTAAALAEQSRRQDLPLPEDGLDDLARHVDAAVFDGSEVAEERVAEAWSSADATVGAATKAAGPLRARLAAFRYRRRPRARRA
ncbi:transglutaminaseTgpA domain-containing protein [Leifsonia sp. F6_8S_P_1B]|uniref:TransglutaminaseTgpA domain-containing protein n=1 Tax=Leifsonia williamsii TaxID=3035919 RepID=A0ABT8KBY7_9MICO|nr:transglutaminaseTgpA domain-containing protein [Leifsonia williamsii]MDN4614974.1 transglutaminaseTgpA domain-containing protein [Leifsonia williamsii]